MTDPATGGQYTPKIYTSEKTSDPETAWLHNRIVLKPPDPAFEPLVLTPREESEVRELVEVIAPMGDQERRG